MNTTQQAEELYDVIVRNTTAHHTKLSGVEIRFDGCILTAIAAALSRAREEAIEMLDPFLTHNPGCLSTNRFRVRKDDLPNECDCGLEAAIRARKGASRE